ncbi:MAG: hypothetical protein QM719_10370 [Thermomonas sp.]
MRILLGVSIAAMALASAAQPANAVVETRYQRAQGGVVCRLTDVSLNTTVKAKATGFRNEGTVSQFVICGMESANSQEAIGTITGLSIGLYSLNGVSKNVTCTAVNGYANSTPLYSAKTIATNAGVAAATISFDAADFGGTPGQPLAQNDYWSITCNLPAQTSVGFMTTSFNVNTPAS